MNTIRRAGVGNTTDAWSATETIHVFEKATAAPTRDIAQIAIGLVVWRRDELIDTCASRHGTPLASCVISFFIMLGSGAWARATPRRSGGHRI